MKTTTIYILLLVSVFAHAQEKYTAADKSFESLWYKKAAKQYEQLIAKGDRTQELLQKTGDAYFYNSDMENAHKLYGELFANYEKKLDPIYIFRYIHSLKGIGNYTLAKALMKIHADKLNASGYQVDQLRENDDRLDALLNKQPEFYVTNLSINSPVADFGTAFYGDSIVFASSRDSLRLRTRLYQWNEQPYLNLYVADTTSQGTDLKNGRLLSKKINTKYHEALAVFTKDGNRMYFTRNNYTDGQAKFDAEGFNHLKLYYADKVAGAWEQPIEVPFNSNDYSVGQPALSSDENQLYFVSDMPGTLGATDIFVVSISDDGEFSAPKNIGDTINTSGREMFPFVTEERFYFASDGHLGLGGLDVFESKMTNGFSKPENLGMPLNSNKDDFAYIVNEGTRRGYVSSNRKGGVGDDDIYSFERLEAKCQQTLTGTVKRKANDLPVSNAQIKLLDESSELLEETMTDAYGVFLFTSMLSCETTYELRLEKEGFLPKSEPFTTSDTADLENNLPLLMEKELNKLIVNENGVLKIKIDNIYFDLNKADIRPDAAQELDKIVEVMKEYPKMVIKIEAHTDSRGSDGYNEKLSDRRAKSTGAYVVSQGIEENRIESAIGYGEQRLLNQCANGVRCNNSEHDINRRSEFIIVQLE